MSEGNCYFCDKRFWTERVIICLDCLRELSNYKNGKFIFKVENEVNAIAGSDIETNLEILEKFIIPNLKKRLKKEKQSGEKQK